MYVGFIDLEKTYDRVNREALWQVLRMCDVGGKLLSGIKCMYVDSLACLNVRQSKRMVQDKSEWRGFVRGNA